MRRQLPTAIVVFVVFSVLTGLVYPLVVTGIAQVAFGTEGRRLAGRARRRRSSARRSSARRSRAPVLPPAPVRGRRRVRRDGRARRPTWDRATPSCSTPWRERKAAYRQENGLGRRRAGARRRDHRLGLRARPAHLAGQRAPAGAARRARRAGCRWTRVLRLVDEATEGRPLGVPRRARRQRTRAQPGARRAPLAEGGMSRGTLRIYLGAAPGVGKTYAMLNEGRRRQARGEDVVVGFVESHGRRRDRRAGRRPRGRARARRVAYRDARLRGDGPRRACSRAGPQLALVDELAHTNVPGCRNEKRWQDVEELLDAGIDVISTLNIQHLESLNDVVEQITGVVQRETIPDEVVRRADQLQLVDLAVETIRARLARGDIYPAERDRRRARQLLPRRQPRGAARARAALDRRPRRGGPRRVPRAPRDLRDLGDARAGRWSP